jgi:hypothetical protein
VRAGKHLHQGALAGAVFADQREDPSEPVSGDDAPVPPGSIPDAEDGGPGSRSRSLLNKLFGAM